MMHTLCGANLAGSLPALYPQNAMLDDMSRQMTLPQATRKSPRGSNGQRLGTATRVAKPTSVNNSPRSSMSRRRTMMNDESASRRRQQALEQASMGYGIDNARPTPPSSRPLSWHPDSYGQHFQTPVVPTCYPLSTPNMYADQQDLYMNQPQLSPMATAYSCNTSPTSFSPLPLPFQGTDAMQYFSEDASLGHLATPMYSSAKYHQMAPEFYTSSTDTTADSEALSDGWDWSSFAMHSATSPPTPEAFPQAQFAQPAVCEEQLPCQALDESEDEGEILVGMGLYDTPEKMADDPQLNNYRSTVSSLLGSTFRGFEPRGKGLKLEETWEPPKSDDEDEDEQEASEEGSDDESDN